MFRLAISAVLAATLALPAAAQDSDSLFGALQDALDNAGEGTGGGGGGGGTTANTNANSNTNMSSNTNTAGGGSEAMPVAAGLVDPTDPTTLVRTMQNAGYRAELAVDNIGYPMIRSSTQGINYAIFFYGCTDAGTDCTNVQFEATFTMNSPLSAELMNEFNAAKRFIRVVVNDEGNPAIRMDVNMRDGITEDQFLDYMNLWDILVGDFLAHINW